MGKKKKSDSFTDDQATDDFTLDQDGLAVDGSLKEDGSVSSTDGVSEEAPADEASEAIEPADEAPKADVEGSAKTAEDADEKGPTDGVADPTVLAEAAQEGGEPSTDDGHKEDGEAEEAEAPKDPSEMPGMSPVNGIGEVEAQLNVAPASTNVDGISAGDKVPSLGEVQDAAKPVVDQLEQGLVDSFKDAGNKATEALHGLKSFEGEIARLPAEAKAIVNQLRHMGAHFVAACERIFKRD